MIFLRFAIHVERAITDCFSETRARGKERDREWGTSSPPLSLPRARSRARPRVGPRRIHLSTNDAGESVENDHKSLTSGSFCLHAVSVPFFLSSRACGSFPSPAVTIYSQSHQRHRAAAAARFDRSPRATARHVSFSLPILYCHDNARGYI